MMKYHSALSNGESDSSEYEPLSRFELAVEGSVAFAYDLSQSTVLPDEYKKVDCFFAEGPWQAGYVPFLIRADKRSVSYRSFMRNLKQIAGSETRPVVLMGGKLAINALKPHRVYETELNGNHAWSLCWNVTLSSTHDSIRIVHELAERFNCVGDFCCGYGRTGKIFREHGKRFVMSDINPRCIRAIYEDLSK